MSVEFSAASLVALATAPMVGMGLVAARMVGRSGRIKLTGETLRRSKADLMVLVAYDCLGAVIAVLALVLLGITKPSPLVSYFQSDPWIAWAIFGTAGPLCAVGILDRLPIIRLVSLSPTGDAAPPPGVEGEIRASLAEGAALRRKAVERILKCHYEDTVVVENSERNSLFRRAKKLIEREKLHFDDIAAQLLGYVAEFRQGEMPPEVSELLEQRGSWPTDHDAFEGAQTLVGVSLDQGLNRPVNIACRIAEANASAGPRPAGVLQRLTPDG